MHVQAALEPPFLLRHRVALSKWKPVLEALEDVVLQTSAMESVLEGQGGFVHAPTVFIAFNCLSIQEPVQLSNRPTKHHTFSAWCHCIFYV